ncbi:MAG: type IV pilus assembly protein PilM [Fimbriimonas sp.]
MAKKLSSVLGVDIGSQSIKVCEIRTQGREPIVTALAIVPTPEGAVDHTGVYNADAVGVALKTAIANAGASSPAAVVSIAGQASVLVRTLEVPKMNPQELREHMQWEINRNIPFAESTIVSDFKPLGGDDPNSPNMDVVMAIAPQSAIDTMVQCVKKAGKQAAAIDVEPLSMARSIQTSYADVLEDKTVCMVDIGHMTTSINIYRGQKLLMPRQVPIGGHMFTRALADGLTIGVDEAETLKREKVDIPESAGLVPQVSDPFGGGATQGFQAYNPFADDMPAYTPDVPDQTLGGYTDPATGAFVPPADPYAAPADPYATPADPYATPADPYAAVDPYAAPADAGAPDLTPAPASTMDPETERLYTAIAPILDEFVSEIRRSIEYYQSRGGQVDAVELCGGGARLKGLVPFLSRTLGVSCDAYDPLRRLNVNVRKVSPQFLDEHRHEFAVAVGNGLHIFFD